MKRNVWVGLLGLALGLILAACGGQMGLQGVGVSGSSGSGPLTGAIYTTKGDGSLVNGNVYDSKEEVYLNGGPPPNAPCSAAGLPDGEYYFQVTDPSGTVLLSNDPIGERKVRVTGGVFTAYLGTTHDVGSGRCPGAISVALFPYDDTPNPGGEYKVWLTRVADYDPTQGVFGFLPAKSKTDNFKVRMAGGRSPPTWPSTATSGTTPTPTGFGMRASPPSPAGA